MKQNTLGLKQFRAEGCLSYLLMDRATKCAALVDPVLELMDDYRSYLADHRLKLVWVLDTHTHADHFSASQEIRSEYDVPIGMSAATQSTRVTHRLKHQEKIRVGDLEVQHLATPGHTPDSACYLVSGVVFTGDTLFVGGSGRTDFPGADPAAHYRSLHEVLATLPPETIVQPGHDYNDYLFSTIGAEFQGNPHCLLKDLAAFVDFKNAEIVPAGIERNEEIKRRIDFNLSASAASGMSSQRFGAATACGGVTASSTRFASINVQKYEPKLKEAGKDVLYLDVRDEDEFADGHIPQTTNLPLSELGLHLSDLLQARRIYVSCLSGRRSSMAAKTLSYLGVEDVVNVSGGYKAWTQAGFPIVKA